MKERISNQERLMREKPLKKPITEHPKKRRNVFGMNQNHQELDVVEQITKLKRSSSSEQTPNMPENEKRVAAEEERGVSSFLSVDDFGRRGFNINEVKSQCVTGFDALLIVTELASQILHEEEEEIIKERKKKKQRLSREKALKEPMIKKKSFLDDDEWVHQPARFKKRTTRPCDNQVVRDMPENMRKLIESMNGDNIKLVIQKQLFHTDMNDHHHRMSIPIRQIRSEFLTEEEKTWLDDGKRQMTPLFVQPSLAVSEIAFKRWTTTHSYVLCTGWNDVKAANRLKEGDQVQLWSFRINQQLCLSLARVAQAVQD